MSFCVHGAIGGRPAVVRWQDGKVSGDPFAVTAVQAVIDDGGQLGWTATGPFDDPGLDPAPRALLTLTAPFDLEYALGGEPPEPPGLEPLPPGALP